MMHPAPQPRWPVFAAMALIAAAVTFFQIALMRVFSFTIWHHFAFMVISVALLGFGASGVALQRFPRVGRRPERAAAWWALAFATTILLSAWVVAGFRFDPTRIAADPVQLARLGLYYAVLLVPFTCAGLALVLLLHRFSASAGRLYASDLAGVGTGAMLTIGALAWVGAEGLLWLAAIAAAAAAALLRHGDEERGRLSLLPWLAVPLLLGLTLPLASRLLAIAAGPGKALHGFLDRDRFPEARHVHSEWNLISRVDVVENSGTVTWTANPLRRVPLNPQIQIVIDGDAATPIVAAGAAAGRPDFLDAMLSTAALQAMRPQRVLVIGAGGGVDVLAALHHGARRVDALEVNPAVAALVRGRYADWSGGLFAHDGVRLHVAEGRSFVRHTAERYDLIQLSLVDTWAASASGAYSLTESYLYTVEAFTDYLSRLGDDGILTLTRWLWHPPRETLKLCTTAVAALRRLGVREPERHVVVLALGRLGSVLVKRSAFTPADLEALQRVAAGNGFTFLYAPGLQGRNEFTDAIGASDFAAWNRSYPYDVAPASDDRPFFFQFGRWGDIANFRANWGENLLVLSGRLVLLSTLAQAALLSVVLLVIPAVRPAAAGVALRGIPAVVAYFAAIGASFMLIEVSLMQRFTLFLGHPVYAIASVLAVLLVAAGVGSWFTATFVRSRCRPQLVFAGIAALSIGCGVFLPTVFTTFLGMALPVRIAVTVAILVPLGFLLGMPFPLAVASLRERGVAAGLGWAWAANGCASVIGPLLAVMVAMDFGFDAVLAIAALGYAMAGLLFGRWGGLLPGGAGGEDGSGRPG